MADVPTCCLDDTVSSARQRAGDWATCIVVNEGGIVLGRMFREQLEGDPNARVAEVMRPGPSTFRPNVTAIEMLEYMDRRRHETALVTASDGRLVGLVRREDVERAVRGKGMRHMGALPVDFTREDENGRPWRLSEHLGDSVVLLFLRGDW